MMMHPPTRSHARHRRGFTLVESVVATLIVAGMCVTAMTTVATSARLQGKAADRATAGMLAQALLAEIVSQSYADPNASVPVFGLEPGESASVRAAWNDVDDDNGWTESPLQNKDGTVIPNTGGWRRSVEVSWVNPTNPLAVAAVETGCKRITVSVRHNGFLVATRVALRTNAP
jgi:prepilin-type N-terminal cleavage/methylation domain-containing protein